MRRKKWLVACSTLFVSALTVAIGATQIGEK